MSDSEDDKPLIKARSNERVKMDDTDTSMGELNPGISIRNGPVEAMEVDPPATNGNGIKRKSSMNGKSYKDTTESDDDDVPLTKRRRTSKNKATSDSEDDQPLAKKNGRKPPKVTADQIGEDDDSDVPLTKKLAKEKAAIEKKAETTAKAIRAKKTVKAEESEDSDDVPLKKAKAAPKKKANGVKKEDSDDDKPLKKAPSKRATPKSQSATPAASAKKGKKAAKDESPEEKEDVEDGEEEYKWWEDTAKGDGTQKWTTLEHNGVVFPPEYEPLPKNVMMRYEGVPVKLHPEAEEVATFFGSMLSSTHNV